MGSTVITGYSKSTIQYLYAANKLAKAGTLTLR